MTAGLADGHGPAQGREAGAESVRGETRHDPGPATINGQIVGRLWRPDTMVDAMMAIADRLGALAPELWRRMGKRRLGLGRAQA